MPAEAHPAPFQPVKAEPGAGVAVSVTDDPGVNEPIQLGPQSMPAGDEDTVPDPDPSLATVSVNEVSVTVIVKTSESESPPSSVTVTVTMLVPASVKPGVPVICAVPLPLSTRVAQPGKPLSE